MRFPDHVSGADITTELPAVKADYNTFTGGGERIAAAADMAGKVADHFRQIQIDKETNEAEIAMRQKFEDMKIRMVNQPDSFKSLEDVDAEIGKIREDVTKGLTSNEAQSKFNVGFTTHALSIKSDVNSILRNKAVAEGQMALKENIMSQAKAILDIHNPADIAVKKDMMRSRVLDAVKKGYIEPAAGSTFLESVFKHLPLEQVNHDIDLANSAGTNEAKIDNMKKIILDLDAGDKGMYAEAPAEERIKLRRTAEAYLHRAEVTKTHADKLQVEKNESLLKTKLMNRALRPAELEEAFLQKKVTPKFFEKAMEGMLSSSLTHESDRGAYTDVITSMYTDDPQEVENKIMDYRTNGKLSVLDAMHLSNLHYIGDGDIPKESLAQKYTELDDVLKEQAARDQAALKKKPAWQEFWNTLTTHFGQPPAVKPSPSVDKSTWDKRADGSTKGTGFLGVMKRPDGKVSSEISIGVNLNGKEMEIPTMVPTLTKTEVDYLLGGGKPTKPIIDKAVAHAEARIAAGKSVFAEDNESPKPVEPTHPAIAVAQELTAKVKKVAELPEAARKKVVHDFYQANPRLKHGATVQVKGVMYRVYPESEGKLPEPIQKKEQ